VGWEIAGHVFERIFGGGCEVDIRSVDSLPDARAIDCENAARWMKMAGLRRVARLRREDMVVSRWR
jgi:hypothetical protein